MKADAPNQHEQEISMFLRRIVSAARRECRPDSALLKVANEAWDYLCRQGAQGSALRAAGDPEADGEASPLSHIVATAHECIYLDLGEIPELLAETLTFDDLHDVTWSADNATGVGIKYVRADLVGHGACAPGCGAELEVVREAMLAWRSEAVQQYGLLRKQISPAEAAPSGDGVLDNYAMGRHPSIFAYARFMDF